MRTIQLYCFLLLLAMSVFIACAPDANLLGGGNWQASDLTNQQIRTLAGDTRASQTLYAGSQDGSVFSSSDGQHWRRRGMVATLTRLVFGADGKILYALATTGISASSDGGLTWERINTPTSGLPEDSYTTLAFDKQNGMYVGTQHHGVFVSNASVDGAIGTHWKAVIGVWPREVVINELTFDSTQQQLWAATNVGVYRSQNRGNSWEVLNNGLSPSDGVTTLQPASLAGGNPDTLYAGTKRGVFRSSDAGMHWVESGQLLHGVAITSMLLDFRSTNASTIYVGTLYGAFRSDDDGQNWHGIAGGLPQKTPVAVLLIGKGTSSQLYAAANTVYLFPGTGSGINPTRIITLLLILLFFVLLIFITQRGTRRRKSMLKRQEEAVLPPAKS